MATSRYGNSSSQQGGQRDTLSPNAPVTTSTSNRSQRSGSSSFEGLTGPSAGALNSLINALLYGSATPETRTVYRTRGGQEIVNPRQVRESTEWSGSTGRNVLQVQDANGQWQEATASEQIVSDLSSFGTEAQKKQREALIKGISDVQASLGDYSAGAAERDTALAMQGVLRKAMEQNMPAINRAIENAGVSGGSQSALLSQDLATRAAEQTSALQTQTKAQYGQISSQLYNMLQQMSAQKDPAMEQLIDALGLGRTSSSSQFSSGDETQTSTTSPIGAGGGLTYGNSGSGVPTFGSGNTLTY